MEQNTNYNPDNVATYSLEDDKIRIYFTERLNKEDWNRFKLAGFTWTMKQESDLVATWKPSREDLAIEFCGELQDEQSTMFERSADRADRFSIYRDKRRAESIGFADSVETIGMQSEVKAEKLADRIERQREKAGISFDKASYWYSRIDAVISHAIWKDSPTLRQRRIRQLKKDNLKFSKDLAEVKKRRDVCESRTQEELNAIYKEGHKWHGKEKSEMLSIYANYFENSHSARWFKHYTLRIEFEEKALIAQGVTTIDGSKFKKFGWVDGYQIIRINKSGKDINSVTVSNPKGVKSWEKEIIILIENIKEYRNPTPEEIPAKNKPVSTFNLSPQKLKEIFGNEAHIEEMSNEKWKRYSGSSGMYTICGVLNGELLSFRDKTAPDFKIRGMHGFLQRPDYYVSIIDKPFHDTKVGDYVKAIN